MARQSGKTISEVVLDALRQHRPHCVSSPPLKGIAAWRRLLRADRRPGVGRPETPIEALYDEATGLPR